MTHADLAQDAFSPLKDLRVVVTRPRSQASGLGEALVQAGAQVLYLPTIEIVDPPSWEEFDLAIRKTAEGLYGWVIFTSGNSVERFLARLFEAGLDVRALGRTRIAAVGAATAELLREHGVRADLVPETFSGEDVAAGIGRGPGRVLIPRAAQAPSEMLGLLGAAGWIPEVVTAYVTVAARGDSSESRAVRAGAFDVVTFTSGSTARGFTEIIGSPDELGLGPTSSPGRMVACIGPAAAEVARELGYRVDLVAGEHTSEGIVRALLEASQRAPNTQRTEASGDAATQPLSGREMRDVPGLDP